MQYATAQSMTGSDSTGQGTELRQQAIEALDEQRRLESRHRSVAELAERLERMAILAVAGDREELIALLDQRVAALKQAEALAEQLDEASARAARLKQQLRYQRW